MSIARSFRWLSSQPEPFPTALEPAETGLAAHFENAPFGIAEFLPDGTISEMNPTLRRLLGADLAGWQSASFADWPVYAVQNHGESSFREAFQQILESEHKTLQIETELAASGEWMRWTLWRVDQYDEQEGFVPRVLAIVEDTSARRQLEQRLRQAEKLASSGRLASGVAHDFNNMLTGVLLYCELLLNDPESNPRGRKYAEEIRVSCMQATGLVQQLLSIARAQDAVPQRLSLNEIAEGTRNLLEKLAGENIQLNFSLDPDLALVSMDPVQAQQILLNLVLNARDALPEGGEIRVETRNCKLQIVPQISAAQPSFVEDSEKAVPSSVPCALFVVTDNGHGMDAKTRGKIFEAFFTTKGMGKGTGLGLATVHDIVTRSGGLIHVESAPNSGTRVTVLLPQIASHEAAPKISSPISTTQTISPQKSFLAAQGPSVHVFQPPLPQTSTTSKKEPTP